MINDPAHDDDDDGADLSVAQQGWVGRGWLKSEDKFKSKHVCLTNSLTQELLARGGDAGQQAEARLLARTEVDARRELHNGTNNAGDFINSSKYGFNF